MTNKNIIIIALCLGLLVTLYFSWTTTNACKQVTIQNNELRSELNDYKYLSKRTLEKYSQNLFSENQVIPNIVLLNENSDSINLVDVVGEGTKLVYRFYQTTCVQCVEDELDILKVIEGIIGAEKIIVISDYNKISRLKVIMNRKKMKSMCFIYQERIPLPIEFGEKDVASFFLLDKNLQTDFVFKTGGDQNIKDPYYKRVLQFFEKGK